MDRRLFTSSLLAALGSRALFADNDTTPKPVAPKPASPLTFIPRGPVPFPDGVDPTVIPNDGKTRVEISEYLGRNFAWVLANIGNNDELSRIAVNCAHATFGNLVREFDQKAPKYTGPISWLNQNEGLNELDRRASAATVFCNFYLQSLNLSGEALAMRYNLRNKNGKLFDGSRLFEIADFPNVIPLTSPASQIHTKFYGIAQVRAADINDNILKQTLEVRTQVAGIKAIAQLNGSSIPNQPSMLRRYETMLNDTFNQLRVRAVIPLANAAQSLPSITTRPSPPLIAPPSPHKQQTPSPDPKTPTNSTRPSRGAYILEYTTPGRLVASIRETSI